MSKVVIRGCGGSDVKAELDIITDDFGIEVNGNFYRFDIDNKGSLILPLINGVDVRITTLNGYPAIKIYKD